MSMPTKVIEVTLLDGQKLRFKYPAQIKDEHAAERIADALKNPSVTIRAEDTLYIIPNSAIQLITVSPAPTKLPPGSIRGAKRIT